VFSRPLARFQGVFTSKGRKGKKEEREREGKRDRKREGSQCVPQAPS